MTTREELKEAAFALGKMMAEVGDFYDVAEPFAEGYGVGTEKAGAVETFIPAQLTALNSLQTAAQTVIAWRVEEARASEVSWSKIGEALDMSKQGAQQRFGQ